MKGSPAKQRTNSCTGWYSLRRSFHVDQCCSMYRQAAACSFGSEVRFFQASMRRVPGWSWMAVKGARTTSSYVRGCLRRHCWLQALG